MDETFKGLMAECESAADASDKAAKALNEAMREMDERAAVGGQAYTLAKAKFETAKRIYDAASKRDSDAMLAVTKYRKPRLGK